MRPQWGYGLFAKDHALVEMKSRYSRHADMSSLTLVSVPDGIR